MQKVKSNALWNELSAEQQNTLDQWFFEEKLSYAEILPRAKSELGFGGSCSSLQRYFYRRRHEKKVEELAECTQRAAEMSGAGSDVEAVRTANVKMLNCYLFQMLSESPEKVKEWAPVASLMVQNDHNDAYRQVIEEQLRNMEKRSPESIYHDEFADTYHPVLFTEFVSHARKHGLQYLSEAVLPPPPDPCYRAEVCAALESAAGSDILRQEQLLDFMRARVYRETLLCREQHRVSRDFSAEQLRKLLFASQAESAPADAPGAKVFTLPGGIRMESNHAGAIALLETLGTNWPRALSFEELEPALAGSGFALDGEGVTLLLRLIVSRFVELRTWKAPVATEISARPRASACARLESRTRTWAATLLHGTLRLDDPVVVRFLQLLDGTRDRKELLEQMKAEFPGVRTEELEAGIEPGLNLLHRAGMLEA